MQLEGINLTRPQQVELAVTLLYISLGLWAGSMIDPHPKSFAYMIINITATLAILLFIIDKIWKGRDWARIAFLVVFIYDLPPLALFAWNLISGKPFPNNRLSAFLFTVNFIIQAIALVLVFQKESSAWFNKLSTTAPSSEFHLIKPKQVRTAITLLYTCIGISLYVKLIDLIGILLGAKELSPNPSLLGIMLTKTLVSSAIIIFLYYMISKGKNWARITFLVFFIAGATAGILLSVKRLPQIPISIILSSITISLLELTALVFLFQKAANEWFKRSGPVAQPLTPGDAV